MEGRTWTVNEGLVECAFCEFKDSDVAEVSVDSFQWACPKCGVIHQVERDYSIDYTATVDEAAEEKRIALTKEKK